MNREAELEFLSHKEKMNDVLSGFQAVKTGIVSVWKNAGKFGS